MLIDRECYELTFDDGATIVADAQHEWATTTRAARRRHDPAQIRTTQEIAATVRYAPASECANHSVRTARPVELPEAKLPRHPYALGVWLGEGDGASARFARADPEMVMRLEAIEEVCPGGPPPDRRVPAIYLRASQRQRRELLAGLLDAAGEVTTAGSAELTVGSSALASDVRELVHSLGYRTVRSGCTQAPQMSSTVTFAADDDVFGLDRLRLLHKERRSVGRGPLDQRFITSVAPVESVPVRCVEVDHADHLYLASPAMIPTHNSTLGLDIARSASIKHNLTSVIFSLEMSRNEITMRLLSAEAQIHLSKMRNGTMGEDDWQKLAGTMGKISEAPLFIDDSPNMSLMEIRAKCRRLKQKHDLKLVIIDYLQLMSSGKRVESRQQEVSEFSRALKLLAKELEVPVIAISQLNRGAEQRTDKRPAMSDLRESGCLTAGTKILRADTGAETTMGELFALEAKDVPVWALDERLMYVRRHLTHVFSTGTKRVFRMRLASGKTISATANHPFLAYEGWTPLGELSVGTRIAVPRHVPGPELSTAWDDRRVVMLAHLLGDGSCVGRQPIGSASGGARSLTVLAGPATVLATSAIRNHEARVPSATFQLPKRQIALFLNHLWSAAGSVTVNADGRGGRISLASTSRPLIDGLERLLLRFGISTMVRTDATGMGFLTGYTLEISGVDEQRRFLQEIGVHGAGAMPAARLLAIVLATKAGAGVDTRPRQIWDDVRDVLAVRGAHRNVAETAGVQLGASMTREQAPSRARLGRVAELLGSEDLEILAVNDLLWEEVLEITDEGEQEVFDATVVGTHNFIANGIAVHNSIEQDADIVILLHREDAYERESPRAGEADLIVAKHRNGPTDVITVAFQGHYSRFVDMQNN